MGSHSAQGWYLLLFLLGFTLAPAGLFALGWPVAILGVALLAVSFVGFRMIKEPSANGRADEKPRPVAFGTAPGSRQLGGAA